MLQRPKPGTEFRRRGDKLALFHHASDDKAYWREYWDEATRELQLQWGERADLGEFSQLFDRMIPRSLPVLEAGCGPARYTRALRSHGYHAIGIDYEPDVVSFVKRAVPDLDVRVGDVRALDIDSASIGCYLSLGVIEHFIDGPADVLAEARRVLHPDGVALISVPYLNHARARHLGHLEDGHGDDPSLSFHQYYFSRSDLTDAMRRAGFVCEAFFGYGVEAFLTREQPTFSRIWHSKWMPLRAKRPLRRVLRKPPAIVRDRCAHMLMVVARPAPH